MTEPSPADRRDPRRWRRRALGAGVVALLALITAWAGRGVEFSVPDLLTNLSSAGRLLDDSWPPEWGFWPRLLAPFVETLYIALVGSIAGCVLALPVAILAARPIAPRFWVYLVDRNFMNVLRTMPDLFWAMLFATAVGFGPFAGALALTVFSVAVISKLLSESMESVDLGVLEAVRAGGGNWFETVRFGVIPQVLPQYLSYSLYVFELNIRASVVLGLVGAGGIGMLLEAQRTTFQYQRVTLIVLCIFGFVLAIERVSEHARRRLV